MHNCKLPLFGLFAVLLLFSNSFAEWTYQNSGVSQTLRDICFVDSLTGWAAGEGGAIIHTTDGGETWQKQKSPTQRELWHINMLDGKTGQIMVEAPAARDTCILAMTNDGGETWRANDTGGLLSRAYNAFFLNADTGWVCGARGDDPFFYGAVIKTTDGGRSWKKQMDIGDPFAMPPMVFVFTDVKFYDQHLGWAIAATYSDFPMRYFYRTTDGGEHWETVQNDSAGFAGSNFKIISPDTLIAFHSTGLGISFNSGLDWDWGFPFYALWDFITFDGKTGWILERYDLHFFDLTTRQGQHILQKYDFNFYGMSGDGFSHLWICGDKGKIIKATNPEQLMRVEDRQAAPENFRLLPNYPNPFNSHTVIPYQAARDGHIRVAIYNTRGEHVVDVANAFHSHGTHEAHWYGKDAAGQEYPSGVYIVKMTTEGREENVVSKILLIK